MPEVIAASAVADLIPPHSRVFIQGGSGEPSALISGLQSAPDTHKPVNYTHISIPGINHFNPADFHHGAEFTSFFVHSGIGAKNSDPGRTHFFPLHYRDIYRFLETAEPFDIALIQLAPPDEDGYCSLGTSVDFVPAILRRSGLIIAQINPSYPASPRAPKIPYTSIDYCLHHRHSLAAADTPASSPVAEKIAEYVSSLIDDGDCLQIGVGKLPGAILGKLKQHRRLGFHSGLLCNDVRTLIETGVITGENKSRDRGKHVTGIIFGDPSLYDWCAAHPAIHFRPASYTHDFYTIAGIDNFVSINSVLEADLLGQANAEILDGRQYSAVGGLVDFIRGARHARNGRAILALPATALGGTQSRIVGRVGHVTASRSDIDYVVTEHGIARLSDKPVNQRAAALINIAAPRFRSELAGRWRG